MANLNKLYKCVGENFKDGVPIGYCGDTKTLGEWIELFIKQEKEYDAQLEKQAKFHYKHLKEKDQDHQLIGI